VRHGPRVQLPNRQYLLHCGPVEAVVATASIADEGQIANLWWPEDRAWCVGSEVDSAWTYLGGPAALIDDLVADDRIEVLAAAPEVPLSRVEDWVTTLVAEATVVLLATGEATITTSRGTVHAWLEPPKREAARLRTTKVGDNGVGSEQAWTLRAKDDQDLHREVVSYLEQDVVNIIE
jgi:hypothetical protein